jgi:hypothetical protein
VEWIRTLGDTGRRADCTEMVPLMAKGQTRSEATSEHIRTHLPCPRLALHPEDGGEFPDWHLLRRQSLPGESIAGKRRPFTDGGWPGRGSGPSRPWAGRTMEGSKSSSRSRGTG